jgi:hypothetical protein
MTNVDDLHCREFEESDARKKQQRASANGASEKQAAPTGKNGEEPKSEKRATQAELLIALARKPRRASVSPPRSRLCRYPR